MTLFQLILFFGVAVGLLAVLVVICFDALRKRIGDRDLDQSIPKTLAGGLGLNGVAGPTALLGRRGINKPARLSLDAVIMTPTPGLRVISLGSAALVLILLWSPLMGIPLLGLNLNLLVTALIAYAVLFIAGYEARFDGDGITAPNWLFMDKTHRWEDFISIKDDGHYAYHLRFETGKMALQKYLVGMPTFLTFITELREMNKRH